MFLRWQIISAVIIIWAPSSKSVSSSIPSWQILTAHAQPFRRARDLAFCLKVPLDSLLVWASSEGSGETAQMCRPAWTFAARIGDKNQIRLTRSIFRYKAQKQVHTIEKITFKQTASNKSEIFLLLYISLWKEKSIHLTFSFLLRSDNSIIRLSFLKIAAITFIWCSKMMLHIACAWKNNKMTCAASKLRSARASA